MKTALAIATISASVLTETTSAQEPRIYEADRCSYFVLKNAGESTGLS